MVLPMVEEISSPLQVLEPLLGLREELIHEWNDDLDQIPDPLDGGDHLVLTALVAPGV